MNKFNPLILSLVLMSSCTINSEHPGNKKVHIIETFESMDQLTDFASELISSRRNGDFTIGISTFQSMYSFDKIEYEFSGFAWNGNTNMKKTMISYDEFSFGYRLLNTNGDIVNEHVIVNFFPMNQIITIDTTKMVISSYTEMNQREIHFYYDNVEIITFHIHSQINQDSFSFFDFESIKEEFIQNYHILIEEK